MDSFATLFVYNLGLDYYSKYIERIGAIDAAAVHTAASRHLVPERMLVVAVGDRQKIEADLEKLNLGAMEVRERKETSSSLSDSTDSRLPRALQRDRRSGEFFRDHREPLALRLSLIPEKAFLLPSCPSCKCSWLAAAGRIKFSTNL